jgi:nucleoside-diphosphate-sugar epimerase
MRIAITGATGFLGRYLVRQFAEAGYQLRCWHRPGSDSGGFEKQADTIEWLPGSLEDQAAARELIRNADAVVQWEGPRNRGSGRHGAANACPRPSFPAEDIRDVGSEPCNIPPRRLRRGRQGPAR